MRTDPQQGHRLVSEVPGLLWGWVPGSGSEQGSQSQPCSRRIPFSI